jgi:hypothetical protein
MKYGYCKWNLATANGRFSGAYIFAICSGKHWPFYKDSCSAELDLPFSFESSLLMQMRKKTYTVIPVTALSWQGSSYSLIVKSKSSR